MASIAGLPEGIFSPAYHFFHGLSYSFPVKIAHRTRVWPEGPYPRADPATINPLENPPVPWNKLTILLPVVPDKALAEVSR